MGYKITAKEAREMANSVNMISQLLSESYLSIKWKAEDGKRKASLYVDGYTLEDVNEGMRLLENDGYEVSLLNAGFFFKEIKELTKIIIKW